MSTFPPVDEQLALLLRGAAQTETVADLRKKLEKYLDNFAKDQPFPSKERPLELKKLRVIAFVQNDDTREILQTAQVEVKAAE